MAMDPHRSGYPFILWAVRTPLDQWIVYNEWPQYKTLGMFYDEARKTVKNTKYQVGDIANVIRVLDEGDELGKTGFKIWGRTMDPQYGAADGVDFGRETKGVISQFSEQIPAIKFILPKTEKIAVQRDVIRGLLRLPNPTMPYIFGVNGPGLYVMPHCQNFIRSMQRHYEDPNGESEEYKDPIDSFRYLLAAFNNFGWRAQEEKDERSRPLNLGLDGYENILGKPGLV
jgi:hypothetical protein